MLLQFEDPSTGGCVHTTVWCPTCLQHCSPATSQAWPSPEPLCLPACLSLCSTQRTVARVPVTQADTVETLKVCLVVREKRQRAYLLRTRKGSAAPSYPQGCLP